MKAIQRRTDNQGWFFAVEIEPVDFLRVDLRPEDFSLFRECRGGNLSDVILCLLVFAQRLEETDKKERSTP